MAYSLDYASLDLPLHEDRFEEVPAVVDCRVSNNLDDTGFRIDLHFGNVTTVWEGLRGFCRDHCIERFSRATFGCRSCGVLLQQQTEEDVAIRAFDEKIAVGILHVAMETLRAGPQPSWAFRDHSLDRTDNAAPAVIVEREAVLLPPSDTASLVSP